MRYYFWKYLFLWVARPLSDRFERCSWDRFARFYNWTQSEWRRAEIRRLNARDRRTKLR